ncbi:hypothetical protein [Spirillospora sp. NPDC048819]|uniref:hypothetical protein n=1 Tax=Spirillospora sp. NPDC048819 TaxID=3155268 RepID=UPI0034065B65
MSGKKISPPFVILCFVGFVLIAFALLGTLVVGAKVDEADADKSEVSLQLSTLLNIIVAGLAFILAGLGFQLAAGPKPAQSFVPGQPPAQPYGQAAQPQYQQQAPPSGREWGQQPSGQPPAQP